MDRTDIHKIKLERLSKWIKGIPQPPVRIDIEPTNSCNLKCSFCWTRSQKRLSYCDYRETLPEERIREVLHEAGKMGVIEWQIAGGWEPMAKPSLIADMTDMIKSYKMYGCITTNGTLFTENIIKHFVEIGWDEILFSLEGPDAKTHDSVTRLKGSFDKSTFTMRTFNKWKSKLNKDKPKYSFHAVLTNKNYNKLSEMIRLGYEIGCEGVNFEPLSVWSKEGEKLKLNEKQTMEIQEYAKEAIKISKEFGIHTNVENLLQPRLVEKNKMDEILKECSAGKDTGIINSPCFDPWLNMEIRVNGRVAPCRLCDDDMRCDSIVQKDLKAIWFGNYFENFRKQMIQKNMPKYCYTCAAGNVVMIKKIRKELTELRSLSIAKIKNIVGL